MDWQDWLGWLSWQVIAVSFVVFITFTVLGGLFRVAEVIMKDLRTVKLLLQDSMVANSRYLESPYLFLILKELEQLNARPSMNCRSRDL